MAVNKAAIVACAMLVLAGPALAEKQKSPAPVELLPPALQTPAPIAPAVVPPPVPVAVPAEPAPF